MQNPRHCRGAAHSQASPWDVHKPAKSTPKQARHQNACFLQKTRSLFVPSYLYLFCTRIAHIVMFLQAKLIDRIAARGFWSSGRFLESRIGSHWRPPPRRAEMAVRGGESLSLAAAGYRATGPPGYRRAPLPSRPVAPVRSLERPPSLAPRGRVRGSFGPRFGPRFGRSHSRLYPARVTADTVCLVQEGVLFVAECHVPIESQVFKKDEIFLAMMARGGRDKELQLSQIERIEHSVCGFCKIRLDILGKEAWPPTRAKQDVR